MGLAAIAMFMAGLWIIDDDPPVQFLSSQVIPDSAAPGGRVMTYYRVKVLRGSDECELDVERSWRDAHGNEWPSTTAHLKYARGPVEIGLTMAIPMDAWKGVSAVENTLVSICNPWQRLFPRRQLMPVLQVNVVR